MINTILSLVIALVLHEMGHFLMARACRLTVTQAGLGWGPRLFGIRIYNVDYVLHLLPVGAYIRMDMAGLQRRSITQQLLILLAGIAVNLTLAGIAWGTMFGTLNLALAIGNLLPLYQHDGWKSGMLISRWVFGRRSPVVEWSFTVSGGFVGLVVLARALFSF